MEVEGMTTMLRVLGTVLVIVWVFYLCSSDIVKWVTGKKPEIVFLVLVSLLLLFFLWDGLVDYESME